jgi:CRP-like cAMP-binding protein
LENSELEKLASAMRPEKYKEGDLIIKYGDEGNAYFLLSKGKVKVIVYRKGTEASDPELDQKISFSKVLEQGCGFGELALINNDKRSATIQAVEPCEAYSLDSIAFKALIIKSSIIKRE